MSGASFYTIDCVSTPEALCAIVQGSSTMAPWNDNSFVDPTAVYVWNTQGAWSGAASGVEVPIWKQFYMDSCHPCMNNSVAKGSVYVCVDDQALVYLNNVLIETIQIPGYGPSCTGFSGPFQITPGKNQFEFFAENTGGPAGIIFAIYCQAGTSSMLLMHSDASWATAAQSYQEIVNIVSYCPTGSDEFNVDHPNFASDFLLGSDMQLVPLRDLLNVFRLILMSYLASLQSYHSYIRNRYLSKVWLFLCFLRDWCREQQIFCFGILNTETIVIAKTG